MPRHPLLYFAYGSNLNVQRMLMRCPAALQVGPLHVPNAVLRFRGVADVAYLRGARCPGGLWEITRACEAALDLYEGVRVHDNEGGLYAKRYLTLRYRGEVRRCLYYQMNEVGISPPSEHYFNVIVQGYQDFGLDLEPLDRALQHSWDRKRRSARQARRYELKGRPVLAKPEPEDDEIAVGETELERELTERFGRVVG